MNYALLLYDSVKHGGGALGNVTDRLPGWKHRIQRRGGFWVASGHFVGDHDEALNLFLNGLEYEVREIAAGITAWQGFISEMEFSLNGIVWRRSMQNVSNHVRSLYRSIGNNLLTNGSGESGVWTSYNSPSLVEQSTVWHTDGNYSIHIVAGGASNGAYVQQLVPITARTPYDLRVAIKIVSGNWLLVIVQEGVTGSSIVEMQTATVGESVLELSIPDTNEFAGNVNIWLETVAGGGEIYCDGAVFRRGPIRADSNAYQDTLSQREFGRIETILLQAEKSPESANAECRTYLAEHAWPRSLPPDEFEFEEAKLLRQVGGEVDLSVLLTGYWATLNWRHSHITGTDDASDHVNALVAASELVSAGGIALNAMPFVIETTEPVLVGDILGEIADAGDESSGNKWGIGVYEDRKLNYAVIPREIAYRFRDGELTDVTGGYVHPNLVRPGWVYIDDAPIGPGYASSLSGDDPRWVYAEEVEFEAPDKVRFRRDPNAG